MKIYAGAPAAARQYVEADRGRADDYYLTEGTGIARRFTATDGRVTELGPLTGDGYQTWVAGHDPVTGEPRGQLRTDNHAVRFAEVVVNGPKTWSIAAALHPDIAAAYEAAQDRAAGQILGWLSQHATTRVGPRGGQVPVPIEALEAATVRHYTSRAGDPHWHLHLQINARVFAAGKWRGLWTVDVRDSLAAINGIGHAAMATDPEFNAAIAAHGYTTDATGEILQLADYVGPFSARNAQIARNADRYEREWIAAHPGEIPGPVLRRSWDARAWAEGRPAKVLPRPGTDIGDRWRTELHELGFRAPTQSVALEPTPVGALDRDELVDRALTRLAAARSAWNAADVRGEVERLIAAAGVVVEPAMRLELAEDLTARALTRCVPLLQRDDVPEHIRSWSSPPVLAVEDDLTTRLATRAAEPPARARARENPTLPVKRAAAAELLDPGQAAAVAELAGDRSLLVIEGAAGAGKTTTLAAARQALEAQGRRLVVVTPTLKAAQAAAGEVGAAAGSAARLAFEYGWRWNDDGAWTRLASGEVDAATGRAYAGPGDGARLRPGDLLVVDEAGMLDQDAARAVLTVADECRVRVALIGDRHQLAAVGRGGVLDLAVAQVDADAYLTVQGLHRFIRTTIDGRTLPDVVYAELTLVMRTGDDPGKVFDALLARGQIRLHSDAEALHAALSATAATCYADSQCITVVADTREQVTELNVGIRDRLVAAGRVDDRTAVVTAAGERIGVGDRIVTRRNDRVLRVANRDSWIVTAVDRRGGLLVTPDGAVTGGRPGNVTPARGRRVLPGQYVTAHVELGYASTAHGAQGDTVDTGHLVMGEHTGAAAAYVGMTRGREANTAHLIAAELTEAREQWIAVFGRDRADLGPAHAARLAAAEAASYATGRPLDQVHADLHAAWTAEQNCLDRLAADRLRRDLLAQTVRWRAEETQRQAALESRCEQTADAAQRARQRAAAAGATLAADAARIRATLLAAWDQDRPAARTAAEAVLDGPGMLRLRRGHVLRAAEHLADWADRWRRHLPGLATDTTGLAVLAGRDDDRPALQAAFAAAARTAAETAHPEYAAFSAAATAGAREHADARRQLDRARAQYDDRATAGGSRLLDVARQLADTEGRLTASGLELTDLRARINALTTEPALRAQPADRLSQVRAAWAADREAERPARRPSARTPSTSRRLRPPEPPVRLAARPHSGPAYGR